MVALTEGALQVIAEQVTPTGTLSEDPAYEARTVAFPVFPLAAVIVPTLESVIIPDGTSPDFVHTVLAVTSYPPAQVEALPSL